MFHPTLMNRLSASPRKEVANAQSSRCRWWTGFLVHDGEPAIAGGCRPGHWDRCWTVCARSEWRLPGATGGGRPGGDAARYLPRLPARGTLPRAGDGGMGSGTWCSCTATAPTSRALRAAWIISGLRVSTTTREGASLRAASMTHQPEHPTPTRRTHGTHHERQVARRPEDLIDPSGCGEQVRPEPADSWRIADGLLASQFSHQDATALCRRINGTVASRLRSRPSHESGVPHFSDAISAPTLAVQRVVCWRWAGGGPVMSSSAAWRESWSISARSPSRRRRLVIHSR